MLKGLITCVLFFTCSVFQNIVSAQTISSELKVDSLQQELSTKMVNNIVELTKSFISEKQQAIVKAKAWRPNEMTSCISLYRESKRMFSEYTLRETPFFGSDFKTISFSDPTKSLQKLRFENQRITNNELKSLNFKNELMNYFSSRSLKEANLQYLLHKQTEKEEVLNRAQENDDRIKDLQRDFSGVQNLSQRTEKLKEQISQLKKVYSEKALKKIYDSIGSNKIDSLARIASRLSKERMTEDELLEAINNSFPEYHKTFVDTAQLVPLGKGDLVSLSSEFQRPDLTKLILFDSISQLLPKVNADRIRSQYMKVIDSIRWARMKYEGFTLSENPISENIKASVIRQKQRVWDHLYFDGVLGVLQDGKGTILKVSPSLGYTITNFLSIGLGPSVLLNKDDREWNGKIGVRSFVKGEFWHQRLYIQLEDNIDPVEVNTEYISHTAHSILGGGGCLLPISKTVALNPSIFYRINNNDTQFSDSSPWVFRMGISTITKPIR